MSKKIRKITATSGTGAVAVLMDDGESFLSNNRVVSGALGIALTLEAEINFDTFDGAHLIRRVTPFQVKPIVAPWAISRIATQQNPQTGDNWLEVFILNGNHQEEAYLVFDEAVQLVCFHAALSRRLLSIGTSGKIIVEASC